MNRDRDISFARTMADLYGLRGFSVLPSSMVEKKPLCKYSEYWDAPVPNDLFKKFPTTNLQVICGVSKGLLVIDLDGEEAQAKFKTMGWLPKTWVTTSGGCGKHWWFMIPKTSDPIPKATLWRAGDADKPRVKGESAIERLCDKSLVMAPPSIHPHTNRMYVFEPYRTPVYLGLPAVCPDWILRLPPLVSGTVRKDPARPAQPAGDFKPQRHLSRISYDRDKVIESIPDKLSLVMAWGLRIVDEAPHDGWWKCRAIDRDDVHPSAGFHAPTGVYHDYGSNISLSLFDLAAAMGIYPDWKTSLQALGGQYNVGERRRY